VRNVKPDDKSVNHITGPAERIVGCLIKRHLLKVLHEEVGDMGSRSSMKKLVIIRGSGEPIARQSVCM
jgi:hypothetical protein